MDRLEEEDSGTSAYRNATASVATASVETNSTEASSTSSRLRIRLGEVFGEVVPFWNRLIGPTGTVQRDLRRDLERKSLQLQPCGKRNAPGAENKKGPLSVLVLCRFLPGKFLAETEGFEPSRPVIVDLRP